MKNLTIRDIVKLVKWNEVDRSIKFHYPDTKSNYKKVFTQLCNFSKVKTNQDEFLEIYGGIDLNNEWYKEEKNLKSYFDELKSGLESTYYTIHLAKDEPNATTYSISFIPWKKLSSMPISYNTMRYLRLEDIIAHFIWEITYYGNEEMMKKKGKQLLDGLKDCKSKMKENNKLTNIKKYDTSTKTKTSKKTNNKEGDKK